MKLARSAFYRILLYFTAIALAARSCQDLAAQSPGVYRDRVEPHWFNANNKFWYRNDLAEGRREFWVVDCGQRSRQPAFDHQKLADLLSESLSLKVDPQQLPVESLEFSESDSLITLYGKTQSWKLDTTTFTLTSLNADTTELATEFFAEPRNSRDKGGDVELNLANELAHDVKLIWIDRSGEHHEYGRIASGQTRTQHTYVGHVWALESPSGQILAAFEARPGTNVIAITPAAIAAVQEKRTDRKQTQSSRDHSTASISPNKQFVAFVRNHNLCLRNVDPLPEENDVVQLTKDATAELTFQKDVSRARLVQMQYNLQDPPSDTADVRWSPTGDHLLAFQTQRVPERRVYYVDSSPKRQLQPRLESYPYAKPGDPIPIARPRLFATADGSEIPVSNELFPNPFELRFLKWSEAGDRFWMLYNARGHQVLRVLEFSAVDGSVKSVIDEQSETFIHYSDSGKLVVEWLPDNQLLWASERTGWNHLYRYDFETGELLNPVTTGQWNVKRIEKIDRQQKVIWFYAVGIVAEQDPYHEHFCRVNWDGSNLMILTDGDGTHEVSFSPDRRYFIDRYSRVDLPPVSELRSSDDGSLITNLEQADASALLASRGSWPIRFQAKGRDQQTDIWGIIHLPISFDPERKYPVVENIYAGPHDHHVPKSFRARYRHQHQIADRGIVVVQIDGMGTAWRSKAFHDVCFQNLKDAGFPDRIAWMTAAAEQFPWMDISRVGVYGGSAGAQNAMAALLWHGTFYKAAVADCGCHDNRMDKLWWNEQWMGYPVDDTYAANSNTENAYLLQGQLMLVVGELDRNVDPASTTQVVGKLIKAGKDFEFLLVPGTGHGACETPYASRRRADFLAKHVKAKDN